MQDERGKEAGLTPGQQLFLMGQVAALEQALLAVARLLPEAERKTLCALAHTVRDNQQATATTPAPYRAAFDAARYHTFDRLAQGLIYPPDNDNEDA